MNAIVEVATAEVATQANDVVITTAPVMLTVVTPKVAASTLRVVSISGHSISAVAPDANILLEGLALGVAA